MTKKPLAEMIPEFVAYIKRNNERLNHHAKLQNIYDGNLLTHLLEVLRNELSERAFKRVVPRVVPINILVRIINKLSGLYSLPVDREAASPIDSDIMENAITNSKLMTVFGLANKLFCLHKYVSLELFVHKGKIKTRVLDPSKFLLYSDDDVAQEPNVFLKFMKTLDIRGTQLWFAYSDEEFIAFDTDKKIHTEWFVDNDGINPLGKIPFVIVNQYTSNVMPTIDTDIMEMTLRIPQLLTDLNYAHKFQAHSMVYGIDVDPESQIDGNPDGFTLFNTRDGEGKSGTIGFLKPQVEIEASIRLVSAELGLWLESKGIKSGTIGEADASISGIAKILDEMDTTQARQDQVDVFAYMEDDYWNLYSTIQNNYIADLEEKRGMSEKPLASIKYTEQKPLEDEKTKIEKIALKLTNGLTSKRKALKEANPDLTDEQIEELQLEIEAEKAIMMPVVFNNKEEDEE